MVAVFVVLMVMITMRFMYLPDTAPVRPQVITWDALGYYLILPATIIYQDVKKMEWLEPIVEKYQSTGSIYQVNSIPNGNRVMKYLIGVSILYSPFFIVGHLAAGLMNYPQDGFSSPYQVAVCVAALCYAFMGLMLLRRILLSYFNDQITMITLLLVGLATNYSQYVSVDTGMSHGYIFMLYTLLIWLTIRWHERPAIRTAFGIGIVIGLGVISRPTELVMLFIPLLYATHSAVSRKGKWNLVKANIYHVAYAIAGGIFGILPQILYWKYVTGNFIYDVGSKWNFLDPHWRVLFGWEKGWFIYTPVTILMVIGLWFMRKLPLYRSVLIFFILNTWIVIAWSDWQYGASYSSRALIQSYAIMSIPLAAFFQSQLNARWKYGLYLLTAFLIFLNLFQIWQYNNSIIHYQDMNRRYYSAIFLNPDPTPLEMSLLDTDEVLRNEEDFLNIHKWMSSGEYAIHAGIKDSVIIYTAVLQDVDGYNVSEASWIHIEAKVKSAWGAFDSKLTTQIIDDGSIKQRSVRLQNGISIVNEWNQIEYYFKIPGDSADGRLLIWAETRSNQDIRIKDVQVTFLK